MEILLSAAGVISILVLIFWIFAIPFIYPKYFANIVSTLVPKTYLFLFWNFFLSYFIMGIILILKGYPVFGLILILFLTVGYGFIQYLKSRRILVNGIFSFVLDIAYGSIHQIIFYLFIAGMLFYGIYLFYNQSILYGAIIGYIVIFQLITTISGLVWYNQKKENVKLSTTNELKNTKPNSKKISLKQVLNDFETDISSSFYQLTKKIETLLSVLAEFVYADYIPEKLRTGTPEQIIIVISDYILTENSIPDEEKAILQNLIEKRKELYLWKNNFSSSVNIQSNKLADNKKNENQKIKKSKNEPPKSAGK